MKRWILLLILIARPIDLPAQRIGPAAVSLRAPADRANRDDLTPPREKLPPLTRGERTMVFAIAGALLGGGIGAYIGYREIQNCDACMVNRIALFGAIGGVAGTITGAIIGAVTYRPPRVSKAQFSHAMEQRRLLQR